MTAFAALVLLAAVQTAEDVDDALRRLAHEDIVERQTGAQQLSSIAPAILDAILQLDPARRNADASTTGRLDRLLRRLSEGVGPLLPPPAQDRRFLPPDVTPEDEEILEKLRTIRIGMEQTEAPVAAVIDYLREITGLNIHLQVPDAGMVVVPSESTSLETFLERLLRPQGWAFRVRDGVVLITTIQKALKEVKLELYDVQDMTYGGSDFGRGFDIKPTPPVSPDDEGATYIGEDLANMVKRATPSDAWEEADGLSIQFQNGLLIVRNTRAVHAEVRRFLMHLRILRERKRPGADGFYADLERAETRVASLIEALPRARRGLERQREAEDVELRLRSGDLLRAMDLELSLAGLRLLLGRGEP